MEKHEEGIANGKTWVLALITIIGLLVIPLGLIITINILGFKAFSYFGESDLPTNQKETIEKIFWTIVATFGASVPTSIIGIRVNLNRYFNFRKDKDYAVKKTTNSTQITTT
jgi:hypothetical protein